MKIEWDAQKDMLNQAKHHVSFELAQLVFDDPFHISFQDRIVAGEERWQTFGMINGTMVLLVANTYHNEVIRIISARKATKRERKQYEKTR